MALSFNSVVSLNSTTKNHCSGKMYGGGAPLFPKFVALGELPRMNGMRHNGRLCPPVANSGKVYADTKGKEALGGDTSAASSDQLDSDPTQAISISDAPYVNVLSQESEVKKAPLTVREKLRAARVLSRYGAPKPKANQAKLGSSVLDALKESDKGRRPGLPEAPTNLLDDSKRGMPKAGLTFDLPVGRDLLIIAFSFVFISTVMFATTYLVWKLGAIHFNDN